MSEIVAWSIIATIFLFVAFLEMVTRRSAAEQQRLRDLKRDGLAPHKVRPR